MFHSARLPGEGRPPFSVGAAFVAVPSAIAGAHEGRPYGFPTIGHLMCFIPATALGDRRNNRDFALDIRPHYSYYAKISLP